MLVCIDYHFILPNNLFDIFVLFYCSLFVDSLAVGGIIQAYNGKWFHQIPSLSSLIKEKI
jgi:hypothetical protein